MADSERPVQLAPDHEAKLEKVVTFGAVKGKIGEVVESAGGKIVISSQSGRIHVSKAKLGDGKKVSAGDRCGDDSRKFIFEIRSRLRAFRTNDFKPTTACRPWWERFFWKYLGQRVDVRRAQRVRTSVGLDISLLVFDAKALPDFRVDFGSRRIDNMKN